MKARHILALRLCTDLLAVGIVWMLGFYATDSIAVAIAAAAFQTVYSSWCYYDGFMTGIGHR